MGPAFDSRLAHHPVTSRSQDWNFSFAVFAVAQGRVQVSRTKERVQKRHLLLAIVVSDKHSEGN
jgi:hypothetical protein